ncbi:hypothetical protein JX580_11735 [Thiomicrospira microaerophila]|uniref:hypothetical protein n=1 Tax=Thiomicrospira microaerophila TaxID=406020 RepID=UPI00200E36EB|nr:hypothetical protein [Thiomicrospira microaerophila]UQB42304.1 hypothetical protein JX580_11735 [Thiomicrospira microaerophila]
MIKRITLTSLIALFVLAGCNGADEELLSKKTGQLPVQTPPEQLDPDLEPEPDLTIPISIQLTNPNLFVTGVGEADTTQVLVTIIDETGQRIKNPSGSQSNVRVSFESRPNGGELLTSIGKNGATIQGSEFIDLASQDGRIGFNLRSGTLPGVIEIKVSLIDQPSQFAVSPKINVSSGPAESITFSYPYDSITNLGNGFYQRLIGVSVNDKWGNSVPDGTVVNLTVLDSVVMSNIMPVVNAELRTNDPATAAEIEQNESRLTIGTATVAENATIRRNNTDRFIESGDRVLLWNALATDKLRFVSSLAVNDISVSKNYLSNQDDLDFIIGASLLGASIAGEDGLGNRLTGQLRVQNGMGQAYLTYPANSNSLNLGCGGVSAIDLRYQPLGSAQVWISAESNQGKATTINNQACFAALSPLEIINFNEISSISSTSAISLSVRDAGNVNLPYTRISSMVTIEESAPGFAVSVTPCFEGTVYESLTNLAGACTMTINVVAPIDPDDTASAKVVFRVDESTSVEIDVNID